MNGLMMRQKVHLFIPGRQNTQFPSMYVQEHVTPQLVTMQSPPKRYEVA